MAEGVIWGARYGAPDVVSFRDDVVWGHHMVLAVSFALGIR